MSTGILVNVNQAARLAAGLDYTASTVRIPLDAAKLRPEVAKAAAQSLKTNDFRMPFFMGRHLSVTETTEAGLIAELDTMYDSYMAEQARNEAENRKRADDNIAAYRKSRRDRVLSTATCIRWYLRTADGAVECPAYTAGSNQITGSMSSRAHCFFGYIPSDELSALQAEAPEELAAWDEAVRLDNEKNEASSLRRAIDQFRTKDLDHQQYLNRLDFIKDRTSSSPLILFLKDARKKAETSGVQTERCKVDAKFQEVIEAGLNAQPDISLEDLDNCGEPESLDDVAAAWFRVAQLKEELRNRLGFNNVKVDEIVGTGKHYRITVTATTDEFGSVTLTVVR